MLAKDRIIKHLFRVTRYTAALALLASCSPIVDNRGHNSLTDDLSQIVAGQSHAEDVQALLGTPSATSNFGEQTWYYIGETKETVGMFAPEITDQNVTAISFDEQGVVKDISHYAKKDGQAIEMVGKQTPTEGHKLTFMEQMLGNFGRFNAPGHSIDPNSYQRR